MTDSVEALEVVQRMHDAWDVMDWDLFAAQWHEDGTFESVSQVRTTCLSETLEYERNNRIPEMRVQRDRWTADDNGRVWCRFEAVWPTDSGRVLYTTGATTALVVDGRVAEVMSWTDSSFTAEF
jgi:hypothetical protein